MPELKTRQETNNERQNSRGLPPCAQKLCQSVPPPVITTQRCTSWSRAGCGWPTCIESLYRFVGVPGEEVAVKTCSDCEHQSCELPCEFGRCHFAPVRGKVDVPTVTLEPTGSSIRRIHYDL